MTASRTGQQPNPTITGKLLRLCDGFIPAPVLAPGAAEIFFGAVVST
jgi:hypothetical protein